MTYTGGELNWLNGKYGISASDKSVSVMKLIKNHKPKSRTELYELIKEHSHKDCACGVKSKGTIEDFGKNLYEAQIQAWKKYKYSLQECIQWEYDLFVNQSLRGDSLENKALDVLNKEFSSLNFICSEGYIDEELRVDILIKRKVNEDIVGGIQVKPHTFNLMRKSVIDFNIAANKKWGKPVFYLYYDSKDVFINLGEIIEQIKGLYKLS